MERQTIGEDPLAILTRNLLVAFELRGCGRKRIPLSRELPFTFGRASDELNANWTEISGRNSGSRNLKQEFLKRNLSGPCG